MDGRWMDWWMDWWTGVWVDEWVGDLTSKSSISVRPLYHGCSLWCHQSDPCKAKVNRTWPGHCHFTMSQALPSPAGWRTLAMAQCFLLLPHPHSMQESHTASSGEQALRDHKTGRSIQMLAHRSSVLSSLPSANQGQSHLEHKSLPGGHPPTVELVRWEINRSQLHH